MKIIIMKNPDGTIFTRTPTQPKLADETTETYFARLAATNTKGAVKVAVVEHTTLPPTHAYFKAARVWDGDKVSIDIPLARVAHMGRIRAMRDEKLKELDIETLKGVDVQAQKQVLRDLPRTFDLSGATTADELKLLIPAEVL